MPDMDELMKAVKDNLHFSVLPQILMREGIDGNVFSDIFRKRFACLLEEHTNDSEGLKEESYYYILPAVAVYGTLQNFTGKAAELFREMWLDGARKGAEYLRKKAEDEAFLKNWIIFVTPKKTETGAFRFEIDHCTLNETEYHVMRCPYADFCRAYGCEEILTVFCDSDDISFGNIHPRLIWGRTKTIGRGDAYCDFKYTLLDQQKSSEK